MSPPSPPQESENLMLMIGPLPSREKTLHLFDWSKLTLSGGFDTKEPRNLLP